MTAINDIADLAQVLQDNPQWRDIIRAILLGDEMLEIPERVAALVSVIEMVVERLDRLESDVTELKEGQAKLEEGQSRLESDVAELKEGQSRLESDVAELKEGQSRLESDVAELKEGQSRLESDVAELKEGQSRLESDVAELKEGQSRLESSQETLSSRLGNIIGSEYERRAARSARRLARTGLGVRRAQVLLARTVPDRNEIPELLNEAAEKGTVGDDEADDMLLADIVLLGENAEGSPAYAVCETAVTLYNDDVLRAKRRAGTLERASGITALPAVIGQSAPQEILELAKREDVAFIHLPEDGQE